MTKKMDEVRKLYAQMDESSMDRAMATLDRVIAERKREKKLTKTAKVVKEREAPDDGGKTDGEDDKHPK